MRAILSIDEAEYRVYAAREGGAYRVHVDERSVLVGADHGALVAVDGDTIHVWLDGETQTIRYHDSVSYYGSHADGGADDTILAPMPGTVIAVNARPGAAIARGDTLLVIESMKLETAIKAWRDGAVAAVHVGVGQTFQRGAPLLTLTPQ